MLILSIAINLFLLLMLLFNSRFYSVIKQIYNNKAIGKLSYDVWRFRVSEICQKWLKKTPKMTLNDGSFNIIDFIFKTNESAALQSWQKAGLLLGTGESSDIDKFIDSNGNWKENYAQVDFGLLAYSVLFVCDDKDRIKPAMDYTYKVLSNSLGDDGNIYYRSNIPNIRFVDTVGFTVPFLIAYGKAYNNSQAISLGKNQLNTYIYNGMSVLGIPYHAYNANNNEQLGISGWARGIGWYVLGLIGVIKELNINDPDYEFYKEQLKRLSDKLEDYQNAEGGFSWNIESKGQTETSGTAMIGMLFITAYSLFKDKKYYNCAYKCLEAIRKCTLSNGVVYCSQGDSKGLGLYSDSFKSMPFTQGISIRLCKEVESIKFKDSQK